MRHVQLPPRRIARPPAVALGAEYPAAALDRPVIVPPDLVVLTAGQDLVRTASGVGLVVVRRATTEHAVDFVQELPVPDALDHVDFARLRRTGEVFPAYAGMIRSARLSRRWCGFRFGRTPTASWFAMSRPARW